MTSPALPYIPSVLDMHVHELGELAAQYHDALQEAEPDRNWLHGLASRIRGHIKGCLLNPEPAWRLLTDGEDETVLDEPVSVFTAAVLAFGSEHLDRIKLLVEGCINQAEEDEGASLEKLAFALVWLPEPVARHWMLQFSGSRRQALVYCACFISVWRNMGTVEDTVAIMKRLLMPESPEWLVKAATRLMHHGDPAVWVPILRDGLSGVDDPLSPNRFHLLSARLTLGDTTALDGLKSYVTEANPYREAAVDLCFQYLNDEEGRRWLRPLQAEQGVERIMLIAVGRLKVRGLLPWVLKQLDTPELARLAGQCVARILEVDLEEKGWVADDETLDEAWLSLEGDEHLPWPDVHKIRAELS